MKLAVLDTGFDLGFSFPSIPGEPFDPGRRHPDFLGRSFVCRNFVDRGAMIVSDRFGHGTHCLGTAAGPIIGPTHPRYGIATEADLNVGKVLSDQGAGREQDILAGIEWAIAEKCAIISMSIGRPVQLGEEPDPLYEQMARKLSSTTILAVAAADANIKVAPFSNGGVNARGGEMALAAPGFTVFSSSPDLKRL